MRHFRSRLGRNKFELHLIAFLMMVISPVGMYFAAQGNASAWICILIGVVVVANLLVVMVL